MPILNIIFLKVIQKRILKKLSIVFHWKFISKIRTVRSSIKPFTLSVLTKFMPYVQLFQVSCSKNKTKQKQESFTIFGTKVYSTGNSTLYSKYDFGIHLSFSFQDFFFFFFFEIHELWNKWEKYAICMSL